MMPDRETMICHCHDVTLGALADYIRERKITRWEEIVEDREFLCGDTCDKCHEAGYNNDGYSLEMAVGMVKKGYL
jgi:NAD(P)H-nitrite reductase large subunit